MVFTGEEITPIETVAPSPEPTEEPEPVEELTPVTPSPSGSTVRGTDGFNFWSILAAIPLLLFIACIVILILRQKNIFVYVPSESANEYRLVAKFRGSVHAPYIDISGVTPRPEGIVAIEIKQPLAKKLLGRDFTVHCGGQAYTYKVRRDHPSDWHEYNIETSLEVNH